MEFIDLLKVFAHTHTKNELDSNVQVTYISISEPGSAEGGEQIATKAPRHKAKRVTLWLIFIFASLCLGGVNILPQNAQK
jgi:hypothetical protein